MKKAVTIFIAAIAAILLSSGVSRAEKLREPDVEYSAWSVIETQMGVVKGKVYHAKAKERQELSGEMIGVETIAIVRKDTHIVWVLMPASKTYMEQPFNEGTSSNMPDGDYELTKIGLETLNGHKTTKSKFTCVLKDGKKLEGFLWMTGEGIVVKMDAAGKDPERDARVKIELTNIKIGKQDDSLFELPPGYNKLNVINLPPGTEGDMEGLEGMDLKELMKGKIPGKGE